MKFVGNGLSCQVSGTIAWSSSRPETHYVAEGDLELKIFFHSSVIRSLHNLPNWAFHFVVLRQYLRYVAQADLCSSWPSPGLLPSQCWLCRHVPLHQALFWKTSGPRLEAIVPFIFWWLNILNISGFLTCLSDSELDLKIASLGRR